MSAYQCCALTVFFSVGTWQVMQCGMVNVLYNIGGETREGDGGFGIISGSHKANYPVPEALRVSSNTGIQYPVENPALKPGDAVVFNEACLHCTLPWVAEGRDRLALFYRFSPRFLHFGTGEHPRGTHVSVRQPAWVSELTEAQRAVLEPAYMLNRPLVGNDGVTVRESFRDRGGR